MKKRLIWVLLIVAAMFIGLYRSMPKSFADVIYEYLPDDADVYVYCGYYDGDYIANGSGCIVKTNKKEVHKVINGAVRVSGVSVRFDGGKEDAVSFAQRLRLEYVTYDDIGEIFTVYGHSPFVKGGVYADGVKINIQIACADGAVNIGSPLILGSY